MNSQPHGTADCGENFAKNRQLYLKKAHMHNYCKADSLTSALCMLHAPLSVGLARDLGRGRRASVAEVVTGVTRVRHRGADV